MLLRAFPATTSPSCSLGSGDWPLGYHEILLHPKNLQALRVPAFGYVSISRPTTLQQRCADRIISGGIDHLTGKWEEAGNHLAFCRAVPDDFLQVGETKVPVWLLCAAGVQPTQQVFVVGAVQPSSDTAVGSKPQSTLPPFHLELYLVSHGNVAVSAVGSAGGKGDKEGSQEHQRLSRQSRAIARRVRGCMVRPGSLLATEVLGETIVLQVAAIDDDSGTTSSRGTKEIVSSSPAKASHGSGERFGLSSSLDHRQPLGVVASTKHDSNRASSSEVILPSTKLTLVQPRSDSCGTLGTRRGKQRGHGWRPRAGAGTTDDPDAELRSPCLGRRDRWSERAPGLEAALSELHMLIVLSVMGRKDDIEVLCSDRESTSVAEKTGDISPSSVDVLCHGSPADAESPNKQRQAVKPRFDDTSNWTSVVGRRALGDHSSGRVGARNPCPNDEDASGDAGLLRLSDVLPAGIALCGPSGVGKSFALDVLSEDLIERNGLHVVRLLGPEILADFSGHGNSGGGSSNGRQATGRRGSLAIALNNARAHAPAVIVIDELDALFDAIGGEEGTVSIGEGVKASSALLEVLDRTSETTGVSVLGATRRSPGGRGGAGWTGLDGEGGVAGDGTAMPAAYRKPGRFDRCVVVGPPTQVERERILRILLVSQSWELEPLAAETHFPESVTAAIDAEGERVCNTEARSVVEAWAKRLSSVTPGMVGGDLERLVRTAGARAAQRTLRTVCPSQRPPPPPLLRPGQTPDSTPKTTTRPPPPTPPKILMWRDAMRAAAVTVPRVLRGMDVMSSGGADGSNGRGPTWDSVGGFSEARRRLQRLVQWPWLHPEAFARLGISAPAGALLYGPSGCGKTLMARVVAAECLANFVCVRSSELLSRYLGETEAKLRGLFARARAAAPCILFLDELDAITAKRGDSGMGGGEGGGTSGVHARVLSTLLNEMDGVAGSTSMRRSVLSGGDGDGVTSVHSPGVLVLAASNRKDALDAALLRPGRLHECVELGMPGREDREGVLRVHARRLPLSAEVDLERLSQDDASGGLSCADLEASCRDAAMMALRENVDNAHEVRPEHLRRALEERMAGRIRSRRFTLSLDRGPQTTAAS